MEKNWIEKVKEAVRIAMNKGLNIEIYIDPSYIIEIEIEDNIHFYFIDDNFFFIDIIYRDFISHRNNFSIGF